MKHNPSIPCILISASLLLPFSLYSQEGGQSGGGDSAAETSVTTSSSKKSSIIPDTVEANPIANVIRAGLPLNQVKALAAIGSAEKFRAITTSGSISDLQNVVSSVSAGAADLTVLSEVVSAGANSATALNRSEGVKTVETTYASLPEAQRLLLISSLKDPSKNIDKSSAIKRAVVVESIVAEFGSTATEAQLATLLADATDLDKTTDFVVNKGALLVSKGSSNLSSLVSADGTAQADLTSLEASAQSLADSGQTLDSSKTADEIELDSFKAAGFSDEESATLKASAYTSSDISMIKAVLAFAYSIDLIEAVGEDIETTSENSAPTLETILAISPSTLKGFMDAIDGVSISDTKYALFETLYAFKDETDVNTNLSSIGVLINSILVDKTQSDLSSITAYRASDIESQGYLDELAYFLSKYNILGPNGANVVKLLDSGTLDKKQESLSGYVGALATYTGSRTFNAKESDFDLSVADIPTDNVDLYPARNFTLSGTLDLSDDTVFPNVAPAPLTNNNVESNDIEIMVIGAAKDLSITEHLTIENDNHVEDHALVIAAADDFYLRSEYSAANADDYSDPQNISITYNGSNLALASQDTMVLVNVDITTGGNLAIGTLGDLHIGLSDAHDSSIDIGQGGKTKSADNLYLYANELLSINGLDIRGHVRKVYMEGKTIDLTNVRFPVDSLVLLRSESGVLNDSGLSQVGAVNLLDKVSHASIIPEVGDSLSSNDFTGVKGHFNSKAISPDGTPFIRVRGQEATAN